MTLRGSAALSVAVLLLASCASVRPRDRVEPPKAAFIVPPALETLTLNASPRPGGMILSVPGEEEIVPRVAFTAQAWAAMQTWLRLILAERCLMRAELQIANGGVAEPDGVCRKEDQP